MLNQFTVSLWGDEAFSAVLSTNSVSEILKIISRDTSPPLYNIILHYWYQIFGISEISIRSLSFSFYLGAIFFTFLIGSLLWNKRTGLTAAAITFLNPFFFIYAFEGRMYSILALGVTASTYFFLKILYSQKEAKGKNKAKETSGLILGYALATAWALYSHHFSIFAVFIQGLWFIYEFLFGHRKTAKKILKGFVLTAILYLPWLYPLYKQVTMVGGGFWLGTPNLTDLRNLIYEYLAEGIKNPPIKLIPLSLYLHQFALYLVFATLILRNWFGGYKKSLILLSFFLGPILITWGVSQKFQSIFFNRYLLYTIPFAMLILASRLRKLSLFVLGMLLIVFTIIDYNYFTHPLKRPFKEMASYVKKDLREGDFLINWNSSAHHLWESKFYNIPAPIFNTGGDLPFYVGTAQMTSKDIIDNIPSAKRVGVITSGPIEEIFIPGYTERDKQIFGELKFIWYIPKI